MIMLDRTTRITSDEHNWILQKKEVTKSGTVVWRSKAFYPNVVYLLNDYLDMAPARSQQLVGTVDSIIDAVKDTRIKILQAIKNKK